MIHLVLLNKLITSESIVIAIVGYFVVFASLVLLYWFFHTLPKILYAKRKKKTSAHDVQSVSEDQNVSGETIAAISLALHLHMSELHDEESGVLTIKKVSKTYSPWNSKIYAVRNQFNRI